MMNTSLKYITIAMIAAGGLIFLSCGAAINEPGRTYYSDYHFSIVFPPGWQVEQEPSELMVEAWEDYVNDDDMFEENMNITYEKLTKKTTLEAYYSEVNRNSRMDLANFVVEKEGEITIDGQPARAIRSTFTMAEGALRMIGYVTIKDDHALTISCLMEPAKYSHYHEIFKAAVHSIKFE
ncbi:MAG: DUF1795 domain-containing protein [candidate division Zixibacteria bacterium]|nr:DUF1795 domain-containing protein [candidate division Zixibacteria bacterium]